MTTIRPRHPGTWEFAAAQAMDLIGADMCGNAIGKSADLIFKASYEDQPFQLSADQMAAIDNWCWQLKRRRPFFAVYQSKMDLADTPHEPVTGIERIAELVRELAEATSAYTIAHESETVHAKSMAAREFDDVIAACEQAKRDMFAPTHQGAGAGFPPASDRPAPPSNVTPFKEGA